jgi:hypothetical protein
MGEHMYRVVFTLLLLSSSALSQEANVFFSYSEWERMSDNQLRYTSLGQWTL